MAGRTTTVDVLVVGAGFAGLATAYHLARGSRLRVVVLERREVPGAHASGRNAALVLQSVASPPLRRCLAASCREYLARQDRLGYRPCGSLLLGSQAALAAVREPAVVASRELPADEARRRVPLLAGHDVAAALLTPDDGVMDIGLLLAFYLEGARAAGVEVRLRAEVTGLARAGADWTVETTAGPLAAGVVVDAAGAWAGELAALAGAAPLPLVPWKRHLFVLDGVAMDPAAPYPWSLERGFYEERTASLAESVSPQIAERAAAVVLAELPALADTTQRAAWSCFRTKAPDGLPVVGWDPVAPGFFWVAGLGGHGMGASWEIGRLAATGILRAHGEREAAFAPARLGGPGARGEGGTR
jgi:D-arginine dehydrogenase